MAYRIKHHNLATATVPNLEFAAGLVFDHEAECSLGSATQGAQTTADEGNKALGRLLDVLIQSKKISIEDVSKVLKTKVEMVP